MLFSLCMQVNGKENNQLNNLLVSSINTYITNYNKIDSLPNANHYYICLDIFPDDFPMHKVPNPFYFTFDNYLIKPLKRALSKGVPLNFPDISLTNDLLNIIITTKMVKLLKDNTFDISTIYWGIYTYKYSCKQQKWILEETKYGNTENEYIIRENITIP